MAERPGAGELLRAAAVVYDAPETGLARQAADAWQTAFASGGEWMLRALAQLRGAPPAGPVCRLQTLGFIKYGLAGAAALVCLGAAAMLGRPLLTVLTVPAFYAVEAQMVFLFPVALDGSRRPFRDARLWTVRAGGTPAVMRVVLPLAGSMLFGGFAGRGFVRSWCLGCLAVCVWYERLRAAAVEGEASTPPAC